MIQDIKSGEKCVCVCGGGGGSGNITCGFQGGGQEYLHFLWRGGVRKNLGSESRCQPASLP